MSSWPTGNVQSLRAWPNSGEREIVLRPLNLVACLAAAITIYAWPASVPAVLVLMTMAILYSLGGKAEYLLYVVGLSATLNSYRIGPVPALGLVFGAVAAGTLARAYPLPRSAGPKLTWLVPSTAVAIYWALRPPGTDAGTVAAAALLLLPLGICVLNMALANCSVVAPIRAIAALTAGMAVSIGSGVVQGYKAVGSNYAGYMQVREFNSVVGESNYAAALSIIPGILILSCALRARHTYRWFLIPLSCIFLSGPVVFASRGAVVSEAVAVVVLLLRPARGAQIRTFVPRAVFTTAIVGVAIVAMKNDWFILSRLRAPTGGGGYLSGRLTIWQFVGELITKSPLLGTGPGHMADLLLSISQTAYAHNFILSIVGQLGFVIGIPYLLSLIVPNIKGWSPVTPALIALGINSLVEPVLDTAIGATVFIGLVGTHFLWRAEIDRGS